MVGETCPFTVTVSNDEKSTLRQMHITVRLLESSSSDTHPAEEAAPGSGQLVLADGTRASAWEQAVATMEPGQRETVSLALVFSTPCTARILVMAEYKASVGGTNGGTLGRSGSLTGRGALHCKKHTIMFEAREPFSVKFALSTPTQAPLDVAGFDSAAPFLLLHELRCVAPVPLHVLACALEAPAAAAHDVYPHLLAGSPGEGLVGAVFRPAEIATGCTCLRLAPAPTPTLSPLSPALSPALSFVSSPSPGANTALGHLVVSWRRVGAAGDPCVTRLLLPPLPTSSPPALTVAISAPASGNLGTVLVVAFAVTNSSPSLQEFEVVLETSEAFMFSGNQRLLMRLPPLSDRVLHVNLVPLRTGMAVLPVLAVTSVRHATLLPTLRGPSHIFIKPRPLSSP